MLSGDKFASRRYIDKNCPRTETNLFATPDSAKLTKKSLTSMVFTNVGYLTSLFILWLISTLNRTRGGNYVDKCTMFSEMGATNLEWR